MGSSDSSFDIFTFSKKLRAGSVSAAVRARQRAKQSEDRAVDDALRKAHDATQKELLESPKIAAGDASQLKAEEANAKPDEDEPSAQDLAVQKAMQGV